MSIKNITKCNHFEQKTQSDIFFTVVFCQMQWRQMKHRLWYTVLAAQLFKVKAFCKGSKLIFFILAFYYPLIGLPIISLLWQWVDKIMWLFISLVNSKSTFFLCNSIMGRSHTGTHANTCPVYHTIPIIIPLPICQAQIEVMHLLIFIFIYLFIRAEIGDSAFCWNNLHSNLSYFTGWMTINLSLIIALRCWGIMDIWAQMERYHPITEEAPLNPSQDNT